MRGARVLLRGAFIGCAACASGPAESLPFYRDATLTPVWLPAEEAAAVHQVASFQLQDHEGRAVTRESLEGRVTLVHFFFAHCFDVCPTTTRNVATALREIGVDSRAQVLSFSVTPERDSAPALRAFAARHGLDDARWRLVTGARSQIHELARSSFFVRLGREGASSYGVASIAHTESVLLVDGRGRLRGVYAASLPLEMTKAVEDVRTLLEEQSASPL